MVHIRIKNNVVEVDNKPYLVTELLIRGRISGSLFTNRTSGLGGGLLVEDSSIVYDF